MSDHANERRDDREERSQIDTRERLVRVEANLDTATTEISRVRERVHAIADRQGALVLLAEEAKDDRDKIGVKIDKLDDKLDPLTVGQAQLATSYAAHVTQCSREKTEFAAAIEALKQTVWKAGGGLIVLWAAVTLALALWKGVH